MLKRFLIPGLLLIFLQSLHSQDDRVFRSLYKEAESILLYLNEDEEALERFLLLEEMDPDNAHIQYKIGICYLHIPGKKHMAISPLEYAVQNISHTYEAHYKERNAPRDAYFYLGMAYHYNNQLDKAIETYNQFLDVADAEDYYNIEYVKTQIQGCQLAKEYRNDPLNLQDIMLGSSINRYTENFNPAVSGNGMVIVFTALDNDRYRIMYTEKVNGTWTIAKDITRELNARGEGISSSLSFDGKTLFVYMDDNGLGNLYMSQHDGRRWQPLERLNRNINTKYWESACCLSPEGNILYFTSNRKGGYGRMDIYKSERDASGEWGPAKNLGPTINSPFSEDVPYLNSDGTLLFFSSQGHTSLGGFDHFYSKRIDSTEWSVPVNLGFPVNTTDDDVFMAPMGSGDTVLYDRYVGGTDMKHAIHMMVLRADDPVSEITLKGTMQLSGQDEIQDQELSVKIIDAVTGKTVSSTKADTASGAYEVKLAPGQYQLVYEAEGFESKEQTLSISREIPVSRINHEIKLAQKELTAGKYLLFENIYFDFNSFALDKESETKLHKISALMIEYQGLKFEVIGHADTVGSKAYNIRLSNLRASNVAQFLFDKGISQSRLVSKGVGEIRAVQIPRDAEKLADDIQRYNRRVEIRVLKANPDQKIVEEMAVPDFIRGKNDLNYTIIVLKVPNRLPPGYFDKYGIEELSYVREQEISDGYLYTLGGFAQKPPAVQMLGKLQKAGLTESRIVDQHELSEETEKEDAFEGYLAAPDKIDDIPYYTIQIFALKKPPHPSAFRGRDDIQAYPCNDGFIRYCIGKYHGYSKALLDLPEIKKEWYKDAFIQELDRMEKGLAPEPYIE